MSDNPNRNESYEEARNILARIGQSGRPDPEYVALAQAYATLALVEEQRRNNDLHQAHDEWLHSKYPEEE